MHPALSQLILHLIFLGLLVWSTSVKRTITDANALYNALQVAAWPGR